MSIQRDSGVELRSFDRAIVSLGTYPVLDRIPLHVFRVLNQIIAEEGKDIEDALTDIEKAIGFSRDEVRAKLEACPSRRTQETSRTT